MDAHFATPATPATTEREEKDRIELLVGVLKGNVYYKIMSKMMDQYSASWWIDTEKRTELEQSIVAYRKLAIESMGISSADFASIHEAVLADARRFGW